MGFDGAGGELRRFHLIHLLLGDATFHLARKWKRVVGAGLGLGIRQPTVEIVGTNGRELGAVGGDQLDLHADDGNGLIAVIGHDEEDGKESVIGEIDGKDFGFLGIVVGVGGDRNLLVAMKVVRGIVECSLRDRLYKALAGH